MKLYKMLRKDVSKTGKIRYWYLVECPNCHQDRWVRHFPKNRLSFCKSCGGKLSYKTPSKPRCDARSCGDGYITKRGYHLVFFNGKYVPAHRLAFPDLPDNVIVHHINGNKLDNKISNLHTLSKSEHRKAHHSLEEAAFCLFLYGLITYDKTTARYDISTAVKKFIAENPVNSGKLQTGNAVGNPEPSQHTAGRCNDYPVEEYIRRLMEAPDTQTGKSCG